MVYGQTNLKKLFRTLAAAGVESFTVKHPWFKEYRKTLNSNKFSNMYRLIERSYLGGRNEGYFIGWTRSYQDTSHKIWVDIDFTGCYPTCMALCPKIDVDGDIDYIPATYRIDGKIADRLKAENIPPGLISTAKKALAISIGDFDKILRDIHQKGTARKIREMATVYDNRLIDKWYTAWKTAERTNDTSIEKVQIPGFALIRFKFPPDTQYPCLPIKHHKYGLLYVLEGETTATASEIILALEAGAEIQSRTSLELPIAVDENHSPIRFILHHLAQLAKDRSGHKEKKDDPKSQVHEKLLKEFMNSLYGKFSQAINFRKAYDPSKGEMKPLGKSVITEPCTASLTTSLARTALSAILIAVDRFNAGRAYQDQITVISATTDGLLIGVPAPEGYSVVDDYYDMVDGIPKLKKDVDKQLGEILKRFGCSDLLQELDKFLSIRQMRNSRLEMTGSKEILEIKHMADEIISVKTRGQIGLLSSGHASILAKFGHKPPLSQIIDDPEEYKKVMDTGGIVRNTEEAEWLLEHMDRIEEGRDKIAEYKMITLKNFRDMIDSDDHLDLTKKISDQKINTDLTGKEN